MSDNGRTGRCLARWLTAAASAGIVIAMSMPAFTTSAVLASVPSAAAAGSAASPILDSVWCAGPDRCLAVGFRDGEARSEAWNGSSWRSVRIKSADNLYSLACTSWTSCMAVGQNPDIEHWNGASWTALPAPPHDALAGVACPASRFCVAVGVTVGGTIASPALVWRGTSWKPVHVPLPAHADITVLSHVACTSAKNCLIVGTATINGKDQRLALAWNGASWRAVAAPHLNIRALACPRPHLCVGIAAGWSLTWNGRSWRHARLAGITAPVGLSCPGTSFCMANSGTETVTWNGRAWSRIAPAGIFTSALWCRSRTSCMTVGGGSFAGNASQWNGRAWRPLRVIRVDSLLTVSCATATACMARLAANDLSTVPQAEQWNGRSWALVTGPAGGGDPTLSCPTVRFCLAVGDSTAQRWNGHRWAPVPVPALHGGFLTALSCANPGSCVAVGTNATAVWDGTSWKTADASISGQSVVLTSVSCAGTDCMAVGYDMPAGCVDDNCDFFQLAEQWDGTAWKITNNTDVGLDNGTPASSLVSCPTASFCLAVVGTQTFDWTSAGQTWQPLTSQVSRIPASLSCPSATDCLVVSGQVQGKSFVNLAEQWNGTSWRQIGTADPHGNLESVSCATPTACVAVGTTADFLTMAQLWDGSHWSVLKTVSP